MSLFSNSRIDVFCLYVLKALSAFQTAMQYNPQSSEVSKKIKKIGQLAKDKQRAEEVENMRSNIDVAKQLDALKSEMVCNFRVNGMMYYFTLIFYMVG